MESKIINDYPLTSIVRLRKLTSQKNQALIYKIINPATFREIISLLSKNKYNVDFLISAFFNDIMKINSISPILIKTIPLVLISEIGNYIVLDNIDEKLQIESRWIIINFTAGTFLQMQGLINDKLISNLINGLDSKKTTNIQCMSCVALANIAATKTKFRLMFKNMILNSELLSKLSMITLELTKNHQQVVLNDAYKPDSRYCLLEAISFLIRNICYGTNQPSCVFVIKIINILCIFKNYKNDILFENLMWSLSYISKNKNAIVQHMLFDKGFINICIECLTNNSTDNIYPAILCMGNLIYQSKSNCIRMLNAGLLTFIKVIFQDKQNYYSTKIKKSLLWLLSNVVVGSTLHIQIVIFSGIIETLIPILHNNVHELSTDVLWIIYNMVSYHSKIYSIVIYNYLIQNKLIQILLNYILNTVKEKDFKILLNTIDHLFKHDRYYSHHAHHQDSAISIFIDYGGIVYLKTLIHSNIDNNINEDTKKKIQTFLIKWTPNNAFE